jgi:hypothetical protein
MDGDTGLKSMKILESRSKVVMGLEDGQTRVAARAKLKG